jgi:hypothetical protein
MVFEVGSGILDDFFIFLQNAGGDNGLATV